MKKAVEFTDNNFTDSVASGITLVDFWAPWCGPCKMIGPIVEDIATEYEGKIKVGKMDIDENEVTPTNFGIRAIPTIMIFKDGAMVDHHVGLLTKHDLKLKIDKALQN